MRIPLASLVVAACLLGCAGNQPNPAPFTAGWQQEVRHYDGKKPPPPPEGINLSRDGAAKIKVDEEGKPRLFLGEGNRVSADLDVGSQTRMRLKVKREWGGPDKAE